MSTSSFGSSRRIAAAVLVAAVAVPTAAQTVSNQLSATERRDGWLLLFDGKTLDGWRGYRQPDAKTTRWTIADGLLCVARSDGRDTRGAQDIVTTSTFGDFELTWDWRVSQGGNSGLKYLVLEDQPAAIGHEYQLIDDERHADAKVGPKRQTAALYDVLAAANRPLKPAGEFNHSRVVVKDKAVEHWLNGTRVLQYELESAPLAEAIAQSKFRDVARFGKRHKAHVLLQDHGEAVCFRDIKIRPGTASPSTVTR